MEPGQVCAYNQTRECFIGQQVVAGDFSLLSLNDRMATLTPNSGAGLWMVPFRGIPATEVRTPLDLLYLDENCGVIDTVEFFPACRVSPSSPPAASVLALPAHAIFSSQTQRGDQLILCSADEMEWRLQQLGQTGTEGGSSRSAHARPPLRPVLVREAPKEPAGPVLVSEQPIRAIDPAPAALVREEPQPAAVLPEVPPALAEQPARPQPAGQPDTPVAKPWMQAARKPAKPALGWLGRWLCPEPADPRKVSRQPVTGLVAHFFTGGAPQAHEIRDVSPTGLFVVTSERWYPGTVIRMTLTKPDSGQDPSERSITVHARAVRWGNDGVGLEFVIEAPAKPGRAQPSPLDPVDGQRLHQFLNRLNRAKA